ncbi:hypothetical protein BGW41_006890 [Actinomortierella wolfii]|nr:hypothetical protein BGW41_006890 [Actinomortierella wolfii]
MTSAGTAAATAAPSIPPTVPTATARQAGSAGSAGSTTTPSSRALPSPSIPSPSSMPNSSTPASSINTPTSGQPFDDLDAKVIEFRQRWLGVKSHPGPDMATPCPEYVTFLPRDNNTGKNLRSSKDLTSRPYSPIIPFLARQNPPTPPLEEIRKNIEMIRSLPPLMSPSIPTWPEPSPVHTTAPSAPTTSSAVPSNTNASSTNTNTNGTAEEVAPVRRLTGGKQPGKVPHMPPNLGMTSDEDDSDDSDAFSDSNRATSDSERGGMSDIETNSRGSKSVGLSKEALRGKRPSSSSRASKTVSETPKSPQHGARARKSSAGSHCVLLNKSQVADLAQQRSDMTLSSNPVVVRINIPSSLLPALKSLPRAIEKAKAPSKKKSSTTTVSSKKTSVSKSKSHKDRWGSDSDSDMDRSMAGTASERDERSRSLIKKKETISGRTRVPSKESLRRRRRSYDSESSESEDRKKSSRKIRESKVRRGSDESDDDKGRKRSGTSQDDWSTSRKRRRDTSPISPDTKRGSLDMSSSSRRESILDSNVESRRRKYDEPTERRSTDRPSDRTLSPAEERARDRLRRPSYHSADEGELVEHEKSHTSAEMRERLDSKSGDKSRTSLHSRRESETSKEKGFSRDRDDDTKSSRQRLQDSRSKDDSKEKDKERERDRDKDRDAGYSRRDQTKDDSRSAQKPSIASKDQAPSSPSRRSGRDDYRDSKASRSTTDRESGTTSSNTYKDRSSKDRHGVSRTHSRSRSRSRSRSPVRNGRYDRRSPTRGSERDGKSTSRRDYEDDRSSSSRRKTDGRTRDSSRDRSDRRGRSRERSGRDRSRSPDRDWSKDRKRARSRDYTESRDSRKEKDRRGRGSVSPVHRNEKSAHAAQESSSKSSTGARHDGDTRDKDKDKDKDGRASSSISQARRPSQAVREDASATSDAKSSTQDTKATASTTANGTAGASSATAATSASTSAAAATPKKTTISMADYQKKRAIAVSESMDTPKMTSDSPAMTSSSSMNGKSSNPSQDSNKPSPDKRSKPTLSPEVTKKMSEYQQVFSIRTAEGANYKHTADHTRTNGDNPRLCAIQYFMAGIEFIAAYVANDKYHMLANPDRPDVAIKDSIGIWETMRQFTTSVTHQCRLHHLNGLDGLSALLELLVYFKVYNYHMLNLRTTMAVNSNFKADRKDDKDKEVMVPKSVTTRMLQCAQDWTHIYKRLDDVKSFTASSAQKAFPDSFAKYCLTGKETTPAEKLVPGTNTQKLQFPLGLHSDLQEVMAFAESALREFQKRNGLEFVKQTKENKDKESK